MLESYLIKLKRSIINVLLQKVLNVSDMEYFMYPSMFRQFNVFSIAEESGRMDLPGTLELSTFISKLLVFIGHTLTYEKSSKFVSSWDLVPRFLRFIYTNGCFCLRHLNFTITLPDLFMQ